MNIPSAANARVSLSVAILALGTLASASSPALAEQPRMRVNVPFSFEVGTKHLQSGIYTVQLVSRNTLLIRGRANSTFAMPYEDESRRPAKASVVVFRRYGAHSFLREIHVAGSSTYLKCMKSPSERRLEIAAAQPAPTDIQVASLDTSH